MQLIFRLYHSVFELAYYHIEMIIFLLFAPVDHLHDPGVEASQIDLSDALVVMARPLAISL